MDSQYPATQPYLYVRTLVRLDWLVFDFSHTNYGQEWLKALYLWVSTENITL